MASVYGTWPYNIVQLGRESTAGTAVAATTVWRGPFGSLEDQRVEKIAEEEIGVLVPAERVYDSAIRAGIALPATELTYEQVLHVLEAGIKTVSPTGTNPYTYTYAFPTDTTTRTIKTYTIEGGNTIVTVDQMEMNYSFVEEFEFSGKADESWMMSSTWKGQKLTVATITGAISAPTVEPVLFGHTKFYVNDSGGTIGTTQVTGKLLNAQVRCKTGIMFVPSGDGNLYPSAHKFVRPEITFALAYELEQDTGASFVATERGKFTSKAARLIRLKAVSSAKEFHLDFAAKYDKFGAYENSDGNTSVKVEGHAIYSSTDSLYFQAKVINALSAVQ